VAHDVSRLVASRLRTRHRATALAVIFAGIVARCRPHLHASRARKNGILPPAVIIVLLVVMAGVITMVVFFSGARGGLRSSIQNGKIGNRMFQGDSSHLPLSSMRRRYSADLRVPLLYSARDCPAIIWDRRLMR